MEEYTYYDNYIACVKAINDTKYMLIDVADTFTSSSEFKLPGSKNISYIKTNKDVIYYDMDYNRHIEGLYSEYLNRNHTYVVFSQTVGDAEPIGSVYANIHICNVNNNTTKFDVIKRPNRYIFNQCSAINHNHELHEKSIYKKGHIYQYRYCVQCGGYINSSLFSKTIKDSYLILYNSIISTDINMATYIKIVDEKKLTCLIQALKKHVQKSKERLEIYCKSDEVVFLYKKSNFSKLVKIMNNKLKH